jgi:uncharacterized protein (DUF58 family)
MAAPLKPLFQKLRNYEIRIRKAINTQMQGDFHSVFKGSGLEFDDVRAYQYGDDVRHIDWNVSAKGHGTFVKTFKEEKEQQLFFIFDCSASQQVGKLGRLKMDVGKEICGVLTLAGTKESSAIGLLAYSDRKERYIKPSKGIKQAYYLISELFQLQPQSPRTHLEGALRLAMSIIKRKSIIVIVSDFLDEGYERTLKAMAAKHDVIAIHTSTPTELDLLSAGIVPVGFVEGGGGQYLNTSLPSTREAIAQYYAQKQSALEALCRQYDINYLHVNTDLDYVPQLIRLFKIRNVAKKR